MPSAHYFTPEPSGDPAERAITVELAGTTVTVTTAGGVFSPNRLDQGTAVLLSCVPNPPTSGDILDLGAGWGPVSYTISLHSPEATVWAVDVNERALSLIERNARDLNLNNINARIPESVPDDVTFDAIWSNPPIRVGKNVLHGMLQTWLPRLKPGASAWLVVQKNLGSDSLLTWLSSEFADGFTATRHSTSKGYRVLRVQRDDAPDSERPTSSTGR